MEYNVSKKLYLVSFVAETKTGETFSDELPMTTIRNVESQVKHYNPDVRRVTAFSAEQVVAAMPIADFIESATITKIGE